MLTIAGASQILGMAFQAQTPPLLLTVCDCVFDPAMNRAALHEPTVGVGAFQPQPLTWPTQGVLNGEAYVESASVIFPAGAYSRVFSRLAVLAGDTVIALGGTLPTAIVMTPATAEVDRTFRFRLYLR